MQGIDLAAAEAELDAAWTALLDGVADPDADRILTRLRTLLDATLRTNYRVTGADGQPRRDGWSIRSAAILRDIPIITTVQGLSAAVQGIEATQAGEVGVRSLQDWTELMAR